MYQQILDICSIKTKASGPGIDPDFFFSNPAYQHEAIECITSVPRKEYSCYMSEVMDRLGYSYAMIKYRQQMYDETDKLMNNKPGHEHYQIVTTGSKGEGTALRYESDDDSMFILNNVICTDDPHYFIHLEDITLFLTERQDTSPGYTILKLLRKEGRYSAERIRRSLFQSETGSDYISSKLLTDDFKRNSGINFDATTGPSTPIHNKSMDYDYVMCFKCFCPYILDKWVHRCRRHGWPSQTTIHIISLLDGHVAPVGFKGSPNKYNEWRICYSLAELHLMRTLNESQLKVYILLKKLSKSVLKPVCEDITSYIIKNVVFWISEANGVDRFTPDMLMDRLLDCLMYLRACVRENNLPSYMIPDRNLLAGRLDIQQKEELSSLLNDLLQEGGRMLLRCDKVRDAMLVQDRIPCMFREFMEKKDKTESLLLMYVRMSCEIVTPEMLIAENLQQIRQDERVCNIFTHIKHLMQLDEHVLRQVGKTNDEINTLFDKRVCQLLS